MVVLKKHLVLYLLLLLVKLSQLGLLCYVSGYCLLLVVEQGLELRQMLLQHRL